MPFLTVRTTGRQYVVTSSFIRGPQTIVKLIVTDVVSTYLWLVLYWIKVQSFTTQSRLLTTSGKQPFENIVGKGENAGNQHFLFSLNVFYPSQSKFQFLSPIYFVVCKFFQFGQVRNFSFDNELKSFQQLTLYHNGQWHNFCFESPWLLFSRVLEVRGELSPERKLAPTWSVFTNHSLERSLSYSPAFFIFRIIRM